MATVKKTNEKVKQMDEREVLLTEEEYARKSRQRTKEKMNRVLRVVGLVASFLLIYIGLFDSMFELSYFGLLFDKEAHNVIWEILSGYGAPELGELGYGVLNSSPIFDDPLMFYSWLPKLMFTFVLIAAVVGTVYLAVYNLVDIINMIKGFFRGGVEVTKDLTGTVKETFIAEDEPVKGKQKKINLFKSKEVDDEFTKVGDPVVTEKTASKKTISKRRKETTSTENYGGLTSEEMDILLNGGSLEDYQPEPVIEQPVEVSVEKDLFKD